MMMGMPMMMPPKLNSSPKQSPSSGGGFGSPKQPTPPPMGQPKVARMYNNIFTINLTIQREFFNSNDWI